MKAEDIKLRFVPGTFKLSKIEDEVYFSKKYKNYISNSRFGLLDPAKDGSPEKFFKGFEDQGFKEFFQLGSAVHMLSLQSEYFALAPDLGKPSAKLGAMADELYTTFTERPIMMEDIIRASNKIDYYRGKIDDKICNNIIQKCTPYWKNRLNYEGEEGKEMIYLGGYARNVVLGCVDALQNNNMIYNLLHPVYFNEQPIVENEQAITVDMEATMPEGQKYVFHIKSKLDNYVIDFDTATITVNDIKTIGRGVENFHDNFINFNYYRELGMYCGLLKLVAKEEYDINGFDIKSNCLIVSTRQPFNTGVYHVTREDLAKGWKEFLFYMKKVAYYYYKGYRWN